MKRREVLQKSLMLAGAACVPSIFASEPKPDCIYGIRPGPFLNCDPTQNCSYYGMVGTYPNCYYPQYTQLNTNLALSAKQVHATTAHAVLNRTVTPTQFQNARNYIDAMNAHLSLSQTTIYDKSRIQFVHPNMYSGATPAVTNAAYTTAADNGFDPNAWAADVQAPICNSSNPPNLQQQILQLPNTQGLDNLFNFVATEVKQVQVDNYGLCHTFGVTNPQGMIQAGKDGMAVGAWIFGLGKVIPPAAPFLTQLGGWIVVFGGLVTAVGEMCVY